jgi:Tol biopolymer transport system component
MTPRFISVIVATLALTVALVAAQASQGEQQLEAARKVEVVDGNYPAAIKEYQAIADKFAKTEPRVAATALLRMADLYQKSGDAQAKSTLERVVKDFAAQGAQVKEARAKLGALTRNAEGLASSPLREGTLCSGERCPTDISAISPDGRWITSLELNGDLQVKSLATGAVELKFPLATPAGIGGVNFTQFSPDSRRIAFVWFGDYGWNTAGVSVNRYTLHIVQNEAGARPRVLIDSPDIRWIKTQSWSNDGSRLLVQVERRDRTTALAWVSVADGSLSVVRSNPANLQLRDAAVSPDGRFIAFASPQTKLTQGPSPIEALEYHLYVMASDGAASPRWVTSLGTRVERPVWSPDGAHLLYTSDLASSVDLFAMPMVDGAPAGAAFPVRRGIGSISLLGVTRDGRLYYSLGHDGLQEMVVASIDVNGKLPAVPQVVNSVSVAGGSWPSWSPDGKHLSFAINRTAGNQPANFSVVVHAMATGQDKVHQHIGPIGGSVQWKADSSEIVFKASPTSGVRVSQYAWYSTRPGGEVGEIVAPTTANSQHGALSKNGTTLFEFRKEGNMGVRYLTAVDVSSGKVTTLHALAEPAFVSPPALSPDGRTLAFAFTGFKPERWTLATVRVDGQGYREIAGLPASDMRQYFVGWTVDGRHLLFTENVTTPLFSMITTKCRLMRIGLDGGQATFTGLDAGGLCAGFAVSPDGTRIALPRRAPMTWDFSVLDISPSALATKVQ